MELIVFPSVDGRYVVVCAPVVGRCDEVVVAVWNSVFGRFEVVDFITGVEDVSFCTFVVGWYVDNEGEVNKSFIVEFVKVAKVDILIVNKFDVLKVEVKDSPFVVELSGLVCDSVGK